MNLNSVLFPAPRPSYSIDSLEGKLIWIPKPKEQIKSISTPNKNCTNFKNRSNSVITYDSPMLQHRKFITVTNPNQKLKSKDIDIEESPWISSKNHKKPPLRQSSALTNLVFVNNKKPANTKSIDPRAVHCLQLNLIDAAGNITHFGSKNDEDESIIIDEPTEQLSLSSRMKLVNSKLPRNKVGKTPVNQIRYNLQFHMKPIETIEATTNEGDTSQTSFDPKHTDEYGLMQHMQTPKKSMFNYSTKKFCNPIEKAKHSSSVIENLAQTLPSSNSKITLHPKMSCDFFPSRESEISKPSTMKSKHSYFHSEVDPREAFTPPKSQSRMTSFIRLTEEPERYIPCMLLVPATISDKVLIYFHGNGEDINVANDLLTYLRNHLIVIIISTKQIAIDSSLLLQHRLTS